jgi:hypothetical protein
LMVKLMSRTAMHAPCRFVSPRTDTHASASGGVTSGFIAACCKSFARDESG